ncbi:sulfuric ester hydrolase [Aureococcus anophagefferens]|nr:sulfuric ester hydrolase [Aureococcus anophagefferens]
MGYNDAPWTSTDLARPCPPAAARGPGVVLSNYYADQSCTPSRAALLTGRHAVELGVYSTVVWDSAWGLDEAKALPALIEGGGAYHKACVGKWDVGHSTAAYLPLARGFDTFTGMLGDMMTDYSTHMAEFTPSGPVYDLFEGDAPSYDYQNTYATDIWTSAATSAVAAAHEAAKGLLLYLVQRDPHGDHAPNHFEEDDEYKALVAPLDAGDYTEQRQLAAGALLVVDRSLETLFQTLDAAGMTDDTLLFFGSDNGGLTGFGGSNYPLRGEKLTLFEGGVRVPAFFWAGASFPRLRATAGAAYGGIVHVSDVAPTLFGAAFGGYDAVSGLDLSGAVLAGEEDAKTRDELVYAATVADFSEDASWDSAGTSRTYVFDLEADPTETTNLVDAEPELAATLVAGLAAALDDLRPRAAPADSMDEDGCLAGMTANAVASGQSSLFLAPWAESAAFAETSGSSSWTSTARATSRRKSPRRASATRRDHFSLLFGK